MTLAEAAPPPLNLASWNLCVLGVAVLSNSRYERTFSLKFEDVCSGIGATKTTKLRQITFNYIAWI